MYLPFIKEENTRLTEILVLKIISTKYIINLFFSLIREQNIKKNIYIEIKSLNE